MLFRVDFELPYPARSQHRHLRQFGAAWLTNPRAVGRNTSQAFHLHSTPELFSRAAEAKVRARAGCQAHRHRGECDLRPRNAHSPAIPVRFGRVWIVPRSLVIAAWRFDLLQNFNRSEEHMSELQSRNDISYAVFCLKKKKENIVISLEALQLRSLSELHGHAVS